MPLRSAPGHPFLAVKLVLPPGCGDHPEGEAGKTGRAKVPAGGGGGVQELASDAEPKEPLLVGRALALGAR